MKRATQLVLAVALVAGAAVLTAGVATAQVAIASYGPSAVTFSPVIENEGMILTVGGGGEWYRFEFKAGETPSFDIFGAQGALPDGVYKWELSPILSRQQIERGEFVAGEASADGTWGSSARGPQAAVQSGTFQVVNGAIVDPNQVEADAGPPVGFAGGGSGGRAVNADGATTNVVLTNADGVIRNSSCIGFDCPNSPSFSDATVLLMENNTRIKFDDTSSLAGFPNNDWELEANSQSSGGANRFGLFDCQTGSQGGCGGNLVFGVEAGARSNALYVESDGDIGIGTNNPVIDIHIKTGNTPAIRLEQDGTAGFTPQVWDVAGNETNFFVRDATNGSALPFRIQPGAGSSKIFIESTGDVGINTTAPESPLHVAGNMRIVQSGATTANFRIAHGNRTWLLQNNGTTNDFELRDVTGNATPFTVEDGAPAGFFKITAAGQVTINGAPVHPDYVFEPDYALESIEEHADYMFANRHLPAVGAGAYDDSGRATLDLVGRSQGVLEELEKAHVYIAQLNEQVKLRNAQIDELLERLARIEETLQQP